MRQTQTDYDIDLLAAAVVPQIRRARAFIDESIGSRTFGCADRAYWYYRTLTNFPGATWQQLMLPFACVYQARHPTNPYYRDPHIATLVSGLLQFWAHSQHRDGSFDEWYINERSYCPTAITSVGAALTIQIMGNELSEDARTAGLGALERAGGWLETRYNVEVMNQNLAAAATLQALAKFFPASRWPTVAAAKLDRVRACQTSEGWFPEYSGMDLGYSTLALDLLAACYMFGGGPVVGGMAKRLTAFLSAVHGAGFSLAGRLGSRGTSHAFPFGALYFAARDSNAAALAERWLTGLARGLVPGPHSVDDRYFAYFYLPQFALAYHHAATMEPPTCRSEAPSIGRVELPESGLAVDRRGRWAVTVSRKLGGAVALQSADDLPLYHLGYQVTLASGRHFSSAVWSQTTPLSSTADGQPIEIHAGFRATSGGIPLRRLMIPFQVVVQALVTSRIAAAFQSMIKRAMISPRNTCPLRLERQIVVGTRGINVRDKLIPEPGLGMLSDIQIAEGISMHSPSGRQDPVLQYCIPKEPLIQARRLLNSGAPATLCWAWQHEQGSPTLILEP